MYSHCFDYDKLNQEEHLVFSLTITNGYTVSLTSEGYMQIVEFAKEEGIDFRTALTHFVELTDNCKPNGAPKIFTRLEMVHHESELWEK